MSNPLFLEIPRWILIDPSISDAVAELRMLQMNEMNKFTVGPQPVREYYAIEYSTEFGYLRLPATTRYKLGIPVMVVTLGENLILVVVLVVVAPVLLSRYISCPDPRVAASCSS